MWYDYFEGYAVGVVVLTVLGALIILAKCAMG